MPENGHSYTVDFKYKHDIWYAKDWNIVLGNPTHKFIYTLMIAQQIVVVKQIDKSLQINSKSVNVPLHFSLFINLKFMKKRFLGIVIPLKVE